VGPPWNAKAALDDLRHLLALSALILWPPALVFWLLVHPLVGLWRRVGPTVCYGIVLSAMTATAALMVLLRARLLSVDFGLDPLLALLSPVPLAGAVLVAHHRRRVLGTRVLMGLAEVAPDRHATPLLREGIYGRIRHPRYVELFLALLGFSLFCNLLATYVLLAVVGVGLFVVVLFEEKELRQRFGAAWDDYARSVPPFFPRRRRKNPPGAGTGRKGATGPPIGALVLIAGFLLAAGRAAPIPDDQEDEVVELRTRKEGTRVVVYGRNRSRGDVTVYLRLARLKNLTPPGDVPREIALPAGATRALVSLAIDDPARDYELEPRIDWAFGTVDPPYEQDQAYRLPWPRGESHRASQTANGFFSHLGRFAVDIEMPIGTEVRCARAGMVILIEDGCTESGLTSIEHELGNTVRVLHDDGSVGIYGHLETRGLRVRKGRRVESGDLLALSGNTGFTSGPHLHFEVRKLMQGGRTTTVPIRFRTKRGLVEIVRGNTYEHPE